MALQKAPVGPLIAPISEILGQLVAIPIEKNENGKNKTKFDLHLLYPDRLNTYLHVKNKTLKYF